MVASQFVKFWYVHDSNSITTMFEAPLSVYLRYRDDSHIHALAQVKSAISQLS